MTEERTARPGRLQDHDLKRPTPLEATASEPWNITYLPTTVKGHFFYLHLILDLYSQKLVEREVYAEESAAHAAETIRKTALRERKRGISPKIVLHSDNGAPMKGATMPGTLQMLGIQPSFGHPSGTLTTPVRNHSSKP
jgi:transposase InsO family protein